MKSDMRDEEILEKEKLYDWIQKIAKKEQKQKEYLCINGYVSKEESFLIYKDERYEPEHTEGNQFLYVIKMLVNDINENEKENKTYRIVGFLPEGEVQLHIYFK